MMRMIHQTSGRDGANCLAPPTPTPAVAPSVLTSTTSRWHRATDLVITTLGAVICLSVLVPDDTVWFPSQFSRPRWDYIHAGPVTLWGASTTSLHSTISSLEIHQLAAVIWAVVFGVLHGILVAPRISFWRLDVGSRYWLLVRVVLLLLHFTSLCVAGSIELGLRLWATTLLEPPEVPVSVEHRQATIADHFGGVLPATSLFAENYLGTYAWSLAMSLLIVMVCVVDLASVEDDYSIDAVSATSTTDMVHGNARESKKHVQGSIKSKTA